MASSELLQTEEIALAFETWTFDPSVLIPDTEKEGLFSFPDEVAALLDDFDCAIYAINAEVFEKSEVDGKEAFVSAGVQPVVVIEDLIFDKDEAEEEEEPMYLVAGGKMLFRGDIFFIHNPIEAMIRF